MVSNSHGGMIKVGLQYKVFLKGSLMIEFQPLAIFYIIWDNCLQTSLTNFIPRTCNWYVQYQSKFHSIAKEK